MATGWRWSGLACVLLVLALWPMGRAWACGKDDPAAATSLGGRIAAIACRENWLWYQPFINTDGHLASMSATEAEAGELADGTTPAWKRVAEYWRGSGLMWQMSAFPGAGTCARAAGLAYPAPDCRAFIIDRPWSAAFTSFVLVRAGVPGFRPSPRHVDYVRDAYLAGAGSPYQLVDPDASRPAIGDMLCYVRGSTPMGPAGLRAWLATNADGSLPMHCEIVVGAGGGRLQLVGGNVLQSVTQRLLPLNRDGRLWGLPRGAPFCSPANEAGCSFNRQDWAALLKLDPSLRAAPPPRMPPATPVEQGTPTRCCVQCVVGSGVPRCPVGATPPTDGG
ncbi:DUF2272 domain-containing protein [Novilysobacter arseniciresistens]|uniref:DUF2272 domain-containing protein n=1 Tax=Novilysobacter arseniciresistens TaxID=1385522 RepID=UPI0009E053AC|nr:DUF2272 domain-containing protein [Lysobacter arseniciresistens]